jgi:hypothetical protein
VSTISVGTVPIRIALELIMVEPKAETGWKVSIPGLSVAGNNNQTVASEEGSRMGRCMRSSTTVELA